MSMFEWKAEYAVGHPEIDSQHKRLFQLAAELHTAMSGGKGKDVLSGTLATLIAYTKHHFASEERLMQAHHYPEYAKHKVLHDQLTARVVAFQKDFAAGRTALSVDLLQFLKDWLAHHIGETDRKITVFLRERAA
jgi:hemerythrin